MGVTGFSCVIVLKDAIYQIIFSGYTSKKELAKALDKI